MLCQNVRFDRLGHLRLELSMHLSQVEIKLVNLVRIVPVYKVFDVEVWLLKFLLYFLH